MTILFLSAGRASRFKESGYTIAKSLIPVREKPMIAWAVESLGFVKDAKKIFLCLREHEEQHGISEKLQALFGKDIQVLFTSGVTEGAAVTALLARDHLKNNEELIISNTDHYFASSQFEETVGKKQFDGVIPVFEATHPRWSFAKINEKGMVTEVAEKVPISNHATVGVYYFRKGKDFVWAAEEMIRKDIRRNNEFYVCPVFNELIGKGKKIKAETADFMWSMGTPEDVIYFEKYYKKA